MCPCEGRRVLDLGTGGGRLLQRLHRVARSVVGIDVSEALLTRARELHAGSVAQMNALELAFPASSFDVVVSLGLSEYLPRLDPLLVETARVLRPGGRLAVTYHQLAPYRGDISEPANAPYFGRTVADRSQYWTKRRHRRAAVGTALARAGFCRPRFYRVFFRIPRYLQQLSMRLGPGRAPGRVARAAVPVVAGALSQRWRLLTALSTGHVLVVATKTPAASGEF